MHYFFHLLNDLSGSPRILCKKILKYQDKGEDCFIVSNNTPGVIDLNNFDCIKLNYRKVEDSFIAWAWLYFSWQVRASFFILKNCSKNDYIHCNTHLTAPILFAAKIKKCKTVVHILETSIKPWWFKKILKTFIHLFSDKIIHVSNYYKSKENYHNKPQLISFPCIDDRLSLIGKSNFNNKLNHFEQNVSTITLICSLVWYKGFNEFIELAESMPKYKFNLVLNGSKKDFYHDYKKSTLPDNLEIFFQLSDISEILNKTSVLVSMTNRKGWIEGWGMTLIEAMSFGIPVIAPNIGGQLEFIEDGKNGFLVDESNIEEYKEKINLLSDPKIWKIFSKNAFIKASEFSTENYINIINKEINFLK